MDLTAIILRAFAVLLLYHISRSIYRLYFHSLRTYAGPKLWSISRIPHTYYRLRGQLPFAVKRLHDQYGSVVRTGPNALSYNTSEAWDKIYGFPTGGAETFQKDLSERFGGADSKKEVGVSNILGANDVDHRRMRRLQAHAFSEKALSAQESVIRGYVKQFIMGLSQKSKASDTRLVPLGAWFNFATFDILGDLAFAESFDCLEKGVLNPWLQTIFESLRPAITKVELSHYPLGRLLLASLSHKFLAERFAEHRKFTTDKVDRRMQLQTNRPDFMSYILKHNETEKGMSPAEIREGASVFIVAGSETTASLLTGLTYQLLQNPSTLTKLTAELRSNFKTAEEMSLHKLLEMRYLQGCLEEGLRMFPPVPSNLPRLVPSGGATICGKFVPEGVSVGVTQWAANYSSANFSHPHEFHPERWIDNMFAADNRKARQPFSMGPRNCIGKNLAYAEMRLILANLLWHFDLELPEESRDWMDRNKVYTIWSKPELKVKLISRNI